MRTSRSTPAGPPLASHVPPALTFSTGLTYAAGEDLDHLLADPAEVRAQLDQHLGRHALTLADETEQDVLGADVVVAEL